MTENSSSKKITPPASQNLVSSWKKLIKTKNPETYDFKSPKIIRPSKLPLKLKTNVRASIENLLVENIAKIQLNDKTVSEHSNSQQASNTFDNSVIPQELKESKERNSLIDSPNSMRVSIADAKNISKDEHSEISPQQSIFKEKSHIGQRKSSSFSVEKKRNTLAVLKHSENLLINSRKSSRVMSKENSPGKMSTITSSKEKNVFNFPEKNNNGGVITNNSSLFKEKEAKQEKLIYFFKRNPEFFFIFLMISLRMKVITEENEESRPHLLSLTHIKTKETHEQKVFIPDSKAYGPKLRGISPKFYHETITKKIDDKKRTGIFFLTFLFTFL